MNFKQFSDIAYEIGSSYGVCTRCFKGKRPYYFCVEFRCEDTFTNQDFTKAEIFDDYMTDGLMREILTRVVESLKEELIENASLLHAL